MWHQIQAEGAQSAHQPSSGRGRVFGEVERGTADVMTIVRMLLMRLLLVDIRTVSAQYLQRI